tara:strand:+ start:829 stop:1218 length:390 start_codon:yes stop_codon:yes gene_type:complete
MIDFKEWKNEINKIVYDKIQLNLEDLPDEDYYILWELKNTSKHVANIILKSYHLGYKIKNENYITFDEWKREVDNIVLKKIGLHCNDIPDYDYWKAWDENKCTEFIANKVIYSYEKSEMSEFKKRRIIK